MDDDGTLVPGRFVFEFPVYAIARKPVPPPLGPLPTIHKVKFPEIGWTVPLFSDAHLADLYIERHPVKEAGGYPINTGQYLLWFLKQQRATGTNSVGFDISFAAGQPEAHIWAWPIDQFIEEVRASFGE
jgi:hypothetical protein